MRVLLSHSDFAPASLALVNVKGFALADAQVRDATSIEILTSHVSEDPTAYVERLADVARRHAPDVVGLSVYIWSRDRMYEATRRVREILPDALIVWGGPDVSDADYALELMQENPGVDVIVRDEGEQTFRRLLRHRLGVGSPLAEIRGITWRDRATGRIESTGTVDFLQNLDEIPSLMDSPDIDVSKVDSLAIETFRGCYMGCNYCYWGGTTRRAFSDSRVYSDLGRILALPNVKNLWFFDSMFGYKKQAAKDILRFIIARKSPGLSITFFPNLDFLDEELCSLFREANVYIEVGIQTTNAAAYENLNRKWDRPFLDKKIPLLEQYGLKSNAQQLILGLPGDDLRGFRASIDYAFATNPECIYVFPFSLLPATGFWRRRNEFGLKIDGQFRIVYESTTFSESDMITGGLIMVGAKWYGRFPGLAQRAVKLLGVSASELFERFGMTFAADVWGLPLKPEHSPALRRKLLLQAFPEHDEQYLVAEALRRTVARYFGGRGFEAVIDEMIRHEQFLNTDQILVDGVSDPASVTAAIETWRSHPDAAPLTEVALDVFHPQPPGPAAPSPWAPIHFLAYPLPAPRDFFKKDRPRYQIVVFRDGPPSTITRTPRRRAVPARAR